MGKKPTTVPCGISDIRRAGGGVAEQEPESSGGRKETDRGMGQRKQFCERWLSGSMKTPGKRKGSGGNRV